MLSPNPVNSELNILTNSGIEDDVNLEVYDRSGKEVLIINDIKISKGEQNIKVNVSELPSGTYIVRLKSKYFTKKFNFY